MVIKKRNVAVYESSTENSEIFSIIMYVPASKMIIVRKVMIPLYALMELISHSGGFVPPFACYEDRKLLPTKMQIWKAVNTHEPVICPLFPLKRFHHGLQTILFSKPKGGVDGATQFKAVIPSHAFHLKWSSGWKLRQWNHMLWNISLSEDSFNVITWFIV